MIPRAFIDAWRAKAPWRSDAMVEQDLIITRALVAIFSDPFLSEHLAFRGGTALHKLFFAPARRYSEDLDFVQLEPGPIGPVFDALHKVLTPLLGKPKRDRGSGVVTLTYRITPELPPLVPMKLKVEINSREHFSVLGVHHRTFEMDSPWHTATCRIPTFHLDELLGTKVRALYQRRKGRDLFDLWLGLTEGGVNPKRMIKVFQAYMEHGGRSVSRAEFEANLAAKRTHPLFTADLANLLPVGFSFEYEQAFVLMEKEVLPLL
jgi:predicted nucleotidyltransferase component of viral defense system